MKENNNNFKEKFQAFWNVKGNKAITIAAGSVLTAGVVLAIALPIALNDPSDSNSASGGNGSTSSVPGDGRTDEEKAKLGILPVFGDGTVTYGLYPQTHVGDETTISALNALKSADKNGWYLYNEEYYVKKTATPDSTSSFKFKDGTPIVAGTEYWYKCELIIWKVLESDNGIYSLVSTTLLDAYAYDDDSSNYEKSQIRTWLTKDFFDAAFKLGSSYIQTTTVDNSASTTSSDDDDYVCPNTNDKVYLLSYKDIINGSYGFSNDDSRRCEPTDYACASGVWHHDNSYGNYWTRSPAGSDSVSFVKFNGEVIWTETNETDLGVRPAITLKA